MNAEQGVRCVASPSGKCRWIETDPADGRPCQTLCALDIRAINEETKRRDE